jgi:hypothetical protein
MDQGRDLNDMISTVLETGLPAGKLKAVIYARNSSSPRTRFVVACAGAPALSRNKGECSNRG